MSWDRTSTSGRRGRLASFAVLALASLATAVGASGLRSLVDALEPAAIEVPTVAQTLVPVSHVQLPAGVAIAAKAPSVSHEAIAFTVPVPTEVVAEQIVFAPIGSSASIARSAVASSAAASVFSTDPKSAPSTYVAKSAPAPTFVLATPVQTSREWAAGGIESFNVPDARASRVVATVAGQSVQIVDAGPLDELGPVAVGGETRTPSVFRPQRVPAVGAGVPVEALDPAATDDVADAARPPVFGPVDHGLPYEVVVDAGNADFVPRWVDDPRGWTPDGPASDLRDLGFLLDANGEIMTDRDGMPILAPEPTALLAVVGAASLLARRRRRSA